MQDDMRECTIPSFPPKYEASYFAQAHYLQCKRVVDVALAIVLLALTGPIILLAAGLVRLTSSGPAFHGHVRLGRFGQPYRLWKLRTTIASDPAGGKLASRPALRSDPR